MPFKSFGNSCLLCNFSSRKNCWINLCCEITLFLASQILFLKCPLIIKLFPFYSVYIKCLSLGDSLYILRQKRSLVFPFDCFKGKVKRDEYSFDGPEIKTVLFEWALKVLTILAVFLRRKLDYAWSQTKRNSIQLSLRLRGINFDILAQGWHINHPCRCRMSARWTL
jgi:hypothetical protein